MIGPYAAALRRLHFYAGAIAAPFFLIAALSGIVMALNAPIERALYSQQMHADPSGAPAGVEAQLSLVQSAFPGARIATYVPPPLPDRTAQFILSEADGDGHGAGASRAVFVDPYRDRIAGVIDMQSTPYAIARKIHGTLLIGPIGDYLIEIAAGFGMFLAISGLLLWASGGSTASPGAALSAHGRWRRRHLALGPLLFLPMIFFFVSGLAWTPVWGGKLVQAWSAFPAARLSAPVGESTHGAMDHGDHRQAPWALAPTPMPASTGAGGGPVTLEQAVAIAAKAGIAKYRVNFPDGDHGVWTISATTISGDLTDPRDERVVHIDRRSGVILADIGFADYSLAGKAMASGVPLHQAGLGGWNIAFNLVFAISVIVMVVSAAAMTLSRRRRPGFSLPPPPAAASTRAAAITASSAIIACLFFPLTAAAFAVIAMLDFISRQSVRARLKLESF